MRDAADLAGGTSGDVLRYFAKLVVPLEEGSRAVVTKAFWLGVTAGIIAGVVAGARMVGG